MLSLMTVNNGAERPLLFTIARSARNMQSRPRSIFFTLCHILSRVSASNTGTLDREETSVGRALRRVDKGSGLINRKVKPFRVYPAQ